MHAAILALALTVHASQFRGPVTIRCQLDTELPLANLRVSVSEKKELGEAVGPDGSVTLSGLPEGDHKLSFFHDDERLGEIAVTAAESGELVRLRIRLVTGNAILLEESRIRGLSESSFPIASTPESTPTMDRTARRGTRPPHCPDPGEATSQTGNITRIVDRETFELQSEDRQRYAVYIGSATRFHEGSLRLHDPELEKGMRVTVRGTVAAGPVDECSIGARRVVVHRR